MMTAINSTQSFQIDIPPSCIVFCPTRPNYCVIGTYLLHKGREGDSHKKNARHGGGGDGDDDDDNNNNDNDESNERDGKSTVGADRVEQKRTGGLELYRVVDGEGPSGKSTICHISSISTAYAVLDARWSPHTTGSEDPVLAVAGSTGLVTLYALRGVDSEPACASTTTDVLSSESAATAAAAAHLVEISRYAVTDPATLVLSLAYHPIREDVLVATLSSGDVVMFSTSDARSALIPSSGEDHARTRTKIQHSHSLEAWCVAFIPLSSSSTSFSGPSASDAVRILSGGDDGATICSTPLLIEGNEEEDDGRGTTMVHWRDSRIHQAGVTAILPLEDGLVVTGSYDDHIRLLAVPSLSTADASSGGVKRCEVLAEENLGGGVWRVGLLGRNDEPQTSDGESYPELQPEPWRDILLLASCMHAGARILRLRGRRAQRGDGGVVDDRDGRGDRVDWRFEVLARFEEHESMNYGSEALPLSTPSSTRDREGKLDVVSRQRAAMVVVSTSFYDRRVCLWQFEPDK